MKRIFIFTAAAIAAFSACSKETFEATSGKKSLIFKASIDESIETKSAISNGRRANWEDSDEVIINNVIYTVSPNAEYATVAELTKKNSSDADPTGTFKAYYPVQSIRYRNESYADSVLSIATIPAVQTYSEGKLDNIPMYAEGTTTNLTFKNICGVLAISGITETDLKAIRVISSTASDKLSGVFTVDAANDYKITMSAPSSNQATLSMGNGIDANGKTFYIALPPAEYGNLQIVTESGDSTIKHMTTKSAITIERSCMYPISFDASKHNGQDSVLRIVATARGAYHEESELPETIDCITLWSGSPIFAQTNVGATLSNAKDATDGEKDADVGKQYLWGEITGSYSCKTYTYELSGKDDSATDYWGVLWRMPKKNEFESLLTNTNRIEKTVTSKLRIHEFAGKGDFSTAILYLPNAGYTADANRPHTKYLTTASYWSATADSIGHYYFYGYGGFSLSYRSDATAHEFSIRAILY